ARLARGAARLGDSRGCGRRRAPRDRAGRSRRTPRARPPGRRRSPVHGAGAPGGRRPADPLASRDLRAKTTQRMTTFVPHDDDMPGLPEMHRNETELLLAYIAQQRDGIIYAAHGLTDEEATSRPTVSGLSLTTLIQHVAHVEQQWVALAADGVWES